MTPEDHVAVMEKLNALGGKVDKIATVLGHESDDGMGGKGLVGEVRRMSGDVRSLLAERNILRGAAAVLSALALALAFVLTNIKGWLEGLAHHGHP